MKEIILEERKRNPEFVSKLEMIDEDTNYEYDIQGWLEDCLDEVDMRGEYELLLRMCDDFLNGSVGLDIRGLILNSGNPLCLGSWEEKRKQRNIVKAGFRISLTYLY